MPFVFSQGVTPLVTSGTPNTEDISLSIRTGGAGRRGSCALFLFGFYVHGRGAGLTAISGISFRIKKMAVASAGGTTVSGAARDAGTGLLYSDMDLQNAQSSISSPGTGPTLHLSIGCGAAGASGWFSSIEKSIVYGLSSSTSLDFFAASGLASMPYELHTEFAV